MQRIIDYIFTITKFIDFLFSLPFFLLFILLNLFSNSFFGSSALLLYLNYAYDGAEIDVLIKNVPFNVVVVNDAACCVDGNS